MSLLGSYLQYERVGTLNLSGVDDVNTLKFMTQWRNQKARGRARYVIRFTLSTVLSGNIGAVIAALLTHKSPLFIMHNTMSYLSGLFLLAIISVMVSMLSWRSNNQKLERLTAAKK
jgi:hypothetical protein